ncbi:hypothetical protein LH464_23780 [Neorhizobium sp. T786]|uniref:hypothetical protein n=1 Tax=Pseudorhizobium xiangyangii TaxID=2883104 RepID=UPI001D0014C1|nr:hypothetical protein [Neorhizobium xiangyangii]MCB5205472.1 hypothetical protein [Neorhizobium xiangyangii]
MVARRESLRLPYDEHRFVLDFLPFADEWRLRLPALKSAIRLASSADVDSPPKPMFLAGNRDDDLIEVPFVAEPAG